MGPRLEDRAGPGRACASAALTATRLRPQASSCRESTPRTAATCTSTSVPAIESSGSSESSGSASRGEGRCIIRLNVYLSLELESLAQGFPEEKGPALGLGASQWYVGRALTGGVCLGTSLSPFHTTLPSLSGDTDLVAGDLVT